MGEETNILRRVLRDDDVSSCLHAASAAAVNSASPRVAHTLSFPLRFPPCSRMTYGLPTKTSLNNSPHTTNFASFPVNFISVSIDIINFKHTYCSIEANILAVLSSGQKQTKSNYKKINDRQTENIIIIIFIYCNWVVTRWQWLFYMYTKHEIGYY